MRSHRSLAYRWLLSVVPLIALIATVPFMSAGPARAAQPLSANITGPTSSNAATVLHIGSETCSAASSDISGATSGTTYTLPVGPTSFASFSSTSLALADSCSASNSLTLEGPTTILGQSADMVVLGQWQNSTDTSPIFTIFFKFSNVNLSSLTSSTASNLGVGLSSAWIAVTNSSTSVDVPAASLPADYLGSDITVANSGVTFRGLLSPTGDLATGLSDLGISSGTELDGTLTGSVGNLSTSAPPSVSAALSLTASVNLALPSTPDWLSLTNPFTLTIDGASDGSWSVTAAGGASVTLPDGSATPVTASIAISKSGSDVDVDFSAGLGTVSNAFGQSWLTLNSTTLDWSISGGHSTATLTAAVTAESTSFTAKITLGADGASVELSSNDASAALDAQTLATDLGLSAWPAGAPDLSISALDLFLQVPKSGSITVSATGTATITIGSSQYSANILLRDDLGSSGTLVVAANPTSSLTLSDLVGQSISPDLTLPNVAVVFASSEFKQSFSSLDPPTASYFQSLLCPTDSSQCPSTLDLAKGVGISASVTLPDSLGGLFCNLLSEGSACTNPFSGPITITGQVPLFGGDTTSLTVALPAVSVNSGAVQQVSLNMSIAESGGTFDFSIGGDLILLAPGSGPTCPLGITAPSGDTCLDLSVSGELSVGNSGFSVQFTGSLTGAGASAGWTLPSPVSWMTVNSLTVQLGVTAGAGAGLTLGAEAAFGIGDTDLEFSIDLEVTAAPPFVDLLGFAVGSHNGLSMSDLVSLYNDVSGSNVSTSGLPPVAIQNLYLSFSTVDDPALCLSQGLYISGDLVLTNSGADAAGGDAPSSQTTDCGGPPSPSAACSGDKTSCLASVFLSVSPSGISGEGYVSGFTAGPLSMDPTDLSFTLNSSEVQVGISGGGTLIDPLQYLQSLKQPGTGCPSGTTDPSCIWASGYLNLQVGTKELSLQGDVEIGTLSASISGTGSFDLSNPGFAITDFFNKVQQTFKDAGTAITSGMDTVANTADAWYSTYVAPGIDGLESDMSSAYGALSTSGPQSWQDFANLYSSISSQINSFNSAVNSADLYFLDIPTDTIFNEALHGISVGSAQVCLGALGCATIFPGFTIPGLCSYDGNIEGTPVCAAGSVSDVVAAIQQQYANPSVDSQLSSANLSLPSGQSESSLVTAIHAIDPPAPSSITCATASEDYSSGATNPETPTTVQVSSLGTSVTFSGPDPTQLGDSSQATSNDQTLSQDTLNALASGQNTGSCGASTTPLEPTLSLSVNRAWVHEGDSVTAKGYLENSSDTSVSINWGDGSAATTATVGSDGSYSATHTYADETGSNSSTSPFTITASATGVKAATQNLTVLDAQLNLSSFTVSPGTVNVMSPVTVSGKISNPESGETTTAVISWGDGTADSSVTVKADGTFSTTHVYERLVPSGSPSQSEPINVTVSEADGTAVKGATAVVVKDVPPTGTTLSPTSGAYVSGGTVFGHAGTSVAWASQSLDISPEQVLSFDMNWADGTADGQVTVAGPTGNANGQSLYPYAIPATSLTHTFANPCLYHVMTTVTDDDTLTAPTLDTPVIITAALGRTPTGTGYWHEQVQAALPTNDGGQVPSAVGCYLKIAQYLSPQLVPNGNLTPSAAASILHPSLGGLSTTAKAAANLRTLLLTSLFNFANGTWDFRQSIGPHGATYASVVGQANAALASGSPQAISAALTVVQALPT